MISSWLEKNACPVCKRPAYACKGQCQNGISESVHAEARAQQAVAYRDLFGNIIFRRDRD